MLRWRRWRWVGFGGFGALRGAFTRDVPKYMPGPIAPPPPSVAPLLRPPSPYSTRRSLYTPPPFPGSWPWEMPPPPFALSSFLFPSFYSFCFMSFDYFVISMFRSAFLYFVTHSEYLLVTRAPCRIPRRMARSKTCHAVFTFPSFYNSTIFLFPRL